MRIIQFIFISNLLHFIFSCRYILHSKKTGFVVEHDFIMATYLADRVIVFEGRPSVDTTAHTPEALLNGMNRFLELLGITFRRDPNNFRPRINKDRSVKVSFFLFFFQKRRIQFLLKMFPFRMLNKNELDNTSSWKIKHAKIRRNERFNASNSVMLCY